jgi:hypothetical protein
MPERRARRKAAYPAKSHRPPGKRAVADRRGVHTAWRARLPRAATPPFAAPRGLCLPADTPDTPSLHPSEHGQASVSDVHVNSPLRAWTPAVRIDTQPGVLVSGAGANDAEVRCVPPECPQPAPTKATTAHPTNARVSQTDRRIQAIHRQTLRRAGSFPSSLPVRSFAAICGEPRRRLAGSRVAPRRELVRAPSGPQPRVARLVG